MEGPLSPKLKVIDVGAEKVSEKSETIDEQKVETKIDTIKKPTTAIALPFSPFSSAMKPTPNQTIKIYHIPAANGSGSSKPPIIKAIKLEKGSKLSISSPIIKQENKEIKPKSTPKKTASESPPKILLKPALKTVMKTQVPKSSLIW